MGETCDHCGPSVRAFVFVMVGKVETTWCGHCANRFYEAWIERGYSIIADLRGPEDSPTPESSENEP